jgi:hypothetical protein
MIKRHLIQHHKPSGSQRQSQWRQQDQPTGRVSCESGHKFRDRGSGRGYKEEGQVESSVEDHVIQMGGGSRVIFSEVLDGDIITVMCVAASRLEREYSRRLKQVKFKLRNSSNISILS